LAGSIDNELDSVASDISLQGSAWGPDVGSAVGDTLNNGCNWDYILGWSTEEENRDGALSGRIPRDGVWLADWNLLVQPRFSDWVSGRISNWWSQGRDCRDDCGDDSED